MRTRAAERRVFSAVTIRQLEYAMGRGCALPVSPLYAPRSAPPAGDDLASRRSSGEGARERLGHARSSMSFDVYSHMIDPGEISESALKTLIDCRPAVAVLSPVFPRRGRDAGKPCKAVLRDL